MKSNWPLSLLLLLFLKGGSLGGGIYFSDRVSGARAIRGLNFDGTGLRTLSTAVADPRGVMVDAAGGRLLFSDRGASSNSTSGSLGSVAIPNGGSITTHLSSLNRPADVKFDAVNRVVMPR